MATKIFLPRLGDSIEEAVIGRWCKKAGDAVGRGEVILELETSKATMDLESPGKGFLLAALTKEGETVQKGTLIAIIGEEGEDWRELLDEDDVVESDSEDKPAKKEKGADRKEPKTSGIDRVRISPNAKRILKDHDIDKNKLVERFPNKRITSADAFVFIDEMNL